MHLRHASTNKQPAIIATARKPGTVLLQTPIRLHGVHLAHPHNRTLHTTAAHMGSAMVGKAMVGTIMIHVQKPCTSQLLTYTECISGSQQQLTQFATTTKSQLHQLYTLIGSRACPDLAQTLS